MRVFIVFATALLAVSALPAYEQWTTFKAKHGKSYENIGEEKVRFQIFQQNIQKINAHNALYEAGIKTYRMGVNQFADLTQKEFGALLRVRNGPSPKQNLTRHVQSGTAPDSIDWREKNAVTRIQNQGVCGSCWAFSVVGAVEGQNAIKYNNSAALSVEQLVDCDPGGYGCSGSIMSHRFQYVIDNGLNTDEEYPYVGSFFNVTCKAKSPYVVKVKEAVVVDATESALKDAVGTVGPVSVIILAEPMQHYKDGIFESDECIVQSGDHDHGILVVGYGTENGKKFWILKNSWGTSWGEDGYFRLARDANNQCGVAYHGSYPILV
ncbi:unnamed protein product [Psylliodes chrysocephalus]|uniref:Uncharacterized protein n=1 Tax=Psylliodes chrysocephalus TaxID=3402493 RepID=A0A9P0CX19_9CUCU|nr:unnamed protein product [Psylliodes chrysocephala]